MGVEIFNTLTRNVEEFVPLDPARKSVGMYCCGPTVHDYAHIGNFRTFVFADLTRRYLEFRGFNVNHVMNMTDVEDKIIKRIQAQQISLRDYTRQYEEAFLSDLQALGCQLPHQMPRATEYIPEIVSLIERLLARGLAYKAADGSVYFSIDKYRGCGCQYGKLVKLNFDEMRPGERVSSDEYAKESIADFALWKARVPEDGAVFWPSPWGEGRPGWHIECSAMSMRLLGSSFDLHLGGEDLMFPHHEDEIAQSEGSGLQEEGRPFVKYWMHGAHLLVEGKKMSKSLGNYFTLRDLMAKGFTGQEIRYLLVSSHYRESFNFTVGGLTGARSTLARLNDWYTALSEVAGTAQAPAAAALLQNFTEAMDNDLNVAAGWGVVFECVRETNRLIAGQQLSAERAAGLLAAWKQIGGVFGITLKRSVAIPDAGERSAAAPTGAEAGDEIPREILDLLEARQAARKAKDFKRSDAIRDELKARGWIIEDTAKGARLKKV